MVVGDFLFFFFNEGEIIAFLHGFLLKLKKLALFFLVWMCFHWKKIFFFLSRLIHFPLLNPPSYFDEIPRDKPFLISDRCHNPAASPSCLPCHDSIHSSMLRLSVESSSRLGGNEFHSHKCSVCFCL